MFRAGHPFFEILAAAVAVNDRGQASAFWRDSPQGRRVGGLLRHGLPGRSEYRRSSADRQWQHERQASIRRQADRMFEPFMQRIWVPAGSETAVDHPGLIAWLDRPYAPSRGDVNLNATRIGQLLDLFGGMDGFTRSARGAEAVGRRDSTRSATFPSGARRHECKACASRPSKCPGCRARPAAGRIPATPGKLSGGRAPGRSAD